LIGGCLEGTRLTVQDRPPEGVEVSIRTPLTPSRWAAYDPEMQAAWEQVCRTALSFVSPRTAVEAPPLNDAILDAVLRLTFFWYNFMPLTRGSAAVGWEILMALLLACGFEVSSQAPEGVALDWEAILTPSSQDFISATRAWLLPICQPSEVCVDELPCVAEVVRTHGHVLDALNAPEPD